MIRITPPRSIFGRLKLLLALVFIFGAIVAIGATFAMSRSAATDAYDRLLISAASQIAETIDFDHDRLVVLPPDSAYETLAQSHGDRFFFAVYTPTGDLLTGNDSLTPAQEPGSQMDPVLGYREFAGERTRTVTFFRLIATPNANGWATVVVAQTLHARREMNNRLMLKVGGIIVLIAALGYFAALEAARRSLLPFDRIRSALAGRKPRDLDPLNVDSPPETIPLIDAINAAMSQLNNRMSKLQKFTGAAAHQIRTPLTALSAQTELISSEKSVEGCHRRAKRLTTHTKRLSRLTNQLLGQAMVSYRTDSIDGQEVDLTETLRKALRQAVPESLDRDVTLDCHWIDQAVMIDGDPIMLYEAFTNLIDNALTHGAPTTLRVQIEHGDDQVCVTVADDGPGISPEKQSEAMQPFGLASAEKVGAGLGLSIAIDVVKAHHGTLYFERADDGFFEVVSVFPCTHNPGRGI